MKTNQLKKIANTLGGVMLGVIGVFLLFSSARSNAIRRCEGIIVQILDKNEELLITTEEVENWATHNNREPLKGKAIQEIDLLMLERRLENSGFIQDCQAYIDLKGYLHLDVKTYQPIARILGGSSMPDRYMDKSGHFFPVSNNYSPTVLLLSGNFFHNRKGLESDQNKDLLGLINQITNDNFWNAQFTRLEVNKGKEILIEPLLGNNIIEFGKPDNIESKLSRLLVFYKKIMSQEVWESFSKVSVKYDGQIVCS